MQDRLDFARSHIRWTIYDKTPVLHVFTESRFCFDFNDRRQLMWRMPKQRFDELNVTEQNRNGKGSVMIGQALALTEKTDLYVIENITFTALRYCNAILDQFVRPYVGAIGPEFILMDDNAHPHRAHFTNAYL